MTTTLNSPAQQATLVEQWQHLVPHVVRRLNLQFRDPDNARSDGLLALWRAARRFDPARGTRFVTLAYHCIRRALWDARDRERRGRMVQMSDVALETLAAPGPDNEGEITRADVARGLEMLKGRDRLVLAARFYEGKTLVETAAGLNITKEGARQSQCRAVKRLRDVLGLTPEGEPRLQFKPAPAVQPRPVTPQPSPVRPQPCTPTEGEPTMTTTQPAPQPPVVLLNIGQVGERLGVSKRAIWRWLEKGNFPQPLRLSATCIRWRESDVAAHLERLARQGTEPDPAA